MRTFAVLLAAGRGERFGSDKLATNLCGKPLWRWSFDTLISHPEIEGVGVVRHPGEVEATLEQAMGAAFVVAGGRDRQTSSRIGCEAVPDWADAIIVHDAARSLIPADVIGRVVAGIEAHGAAAASIPCVDTLRTVAGEVSNIPHPQAVIDRSSVAAMQTPQGARKEWLLGAHREAKQLYTDEMALLEASGHRVELVEGDPRNLKVTTPADLELIRAMLGAVETRAGIGYDVHRFSHDPARTLMLGCVHFQGERGLEGHSDADVIIHASVDAILGAAALGDIGQHFPPEDERWRNENSSTFLLHAIALLSGQGWEICNLDVTVIAERPKIAPRAAEIRESMARTIGVNADRISVKATTNEGLGSIGRGEGIAAFATATIRRML